MGEVEPTGHDSSERSLFLRGPERFLARLPGSYLERKLSGGIQQGVSPALSISDRARTATRLKRRRNRAPRAVYLLQA